MIVHLTFRLVDGVHVLFFVSIVLLHVRGYFASLDGVVAECFFGFLRFAVGH